MKLVRYKIQDRFFPSKRKLKGKQTSISESLTKFRLMKLKEARDQCTFVNVWTQHGKIMFKDDKFTLTNLWIQSYVGLL